MREGTRLTLDILIATAFAVAAAVAGLLLGALLSLIVLFVLSRFFPGPESLGTWLITIYLFFFPVACGLIGGFFGFPLCAIWLDGRRQTVQSNSS
jgi:multisubunit Na+/H+ antiporter MnhE subunit